MARASLCYLDSNVCISFLQDDHPFRQRAIDVLSLIRRKNMNPVISPLVLDETIHILWRDLSAARVADIATIVRAGIRRVFRIPGLQIVATPTASRAHLAVVRFMERFGLRARDAYHLVTMKSNKVRCVATFDRDFDQAVERGAIRYLSGNLTDE